MNGGAEIKGKKEVNLFIWSVMEKLKQINSSHMEIIFVKMKFKRQKRWLPSCRRAINQMFLFPRRNWSPINFNNDIEAYREQIVMSFCVSYFVQSSLPS